MANDPSIGQELVAIDEALASAGLDVHSILAAATSTLSRLKPATWMALVMERNPETSRAVVADDADPAMAGYIDTFIAAMDRPHLTPTIGLSQQVIASGTPIFRKGFALDELMTVLSPRAQAFMQTNPPPGGRREVDFLMVPMRLGGAIFGTISAADWNRRRVLDESDIEWVQAAADRIALSLEHARLAGAVRDNAQRLDLIRSVALALRQREDINLVARVVVEQITSRLVVDAANMFSLAEGGTEMVLRAAAGFRSAPAIGYRVPGGALGLDGTLEPRVEYLSDIDHRGHNPRAIHFGREGFRRMVIVPLHARGRLLGVLELYNRSLIEWESSWLDFFDTFGVLVGVAIDQSTPQATEPSRDGGVRTAAPEMSDLELEILRLVVEGFTNREIADRVHRSENTIKFHTRRILEITGVSNRTELARLATREGWL